MIIDLVTKSRIIDILSLSKSIPVVQRCISMLESALTTTYIVGDISAATKQILGIYSTRVLMLKHLKLGEIEGGDALVNALEKETGDRVRIIAFRTEKEEFLIFTDPELKRLIGCISIRGSHEEQG
jgi:hypothetical protein